MNWSMMLIPTVTALVMARVGEPVHAQQTFDQAILDAQVSAFLQSSRNSWKDMNVPYEDGQILYNLVVKGHFKNILEIGTSTGHSTIWLAWAASKTGGKVITIEIDKDRRAKALSNFKKAGVAAYIDARLGDAYQLVPMLKGPFDFVFCDADKEGSLDYFLELAPKIRLNGCFTAHNVSWNWNSSINRFLEQVRKDVRFRTHIERGSGEGISVSYRIER